MSFRDQVYHMVEQIPKGKVATYGQIAYLCGKPRAARAVGNALRINPFGENVPCHRVVNAKGELSGAFAFGERNRQRDLLESEGVRFCPDGSVDLKRYIWRQEGDNSVEQKRNRGGLSLKEEIFEEKISAGITGEKL